MNEDAAALIVDLAESLDYALTVPSGPLQSAMRCAMQEPRFGDLVVVLAGDAEWSTAGDRVGRYVERWAEQDDGQFAVGFTVHTLDGRETRWTNASMVRVNDIYQAARERLDEARAVVNGRT